MIFSSITFIFLFLPILLFGYFVIRPGFRNLFLLLSSLLFYAWGETVYIIILVISILLNFVFALIIQKCNETDNKKFGKLTFIISIVFNLGLLIIFKYLTFIVTNLNPVLSIIHLKLNSFEPRHLPLGISFFSFAAISYIIDVSRGNVRAAKNLINFSLYSGFFPKLIAGPIVRYKDVSEQIVSRGPDVALFSSGVQRFIIGLGKKVLIANSLSVVVDKTFVLAPDYLTSGVAWLGIICYSLQIYFDFSGYSDMAIGLGRMFGFRFLENFDHPYIAKSIKEFWRKWHISLSSWFRDYLFLPLAYSVSRKLKQEKYLFIRTDKIIYVIAVSVTFLLCGFWHGASWNFAIWGLWHGCFLAFEQVWFGKVLKKFWVPLKHIYVIIVLVIGWVFFKTENIFNAFIFLKSMFGFSHATNEYFFQQFFDNKLLIAMIFGIIFATPVRSYLKNLYVRFIETGKMSVLSYKIASTIIPFVYLLSLSLILFLSSTFLAMGTNKSFIYFKF